MTLAERLRALVKRLDDIGHGLAIANELDSIADECEGKVLAGVRYSSFTAHGHASPTRYSALLGLIGGEHPACAKGDTKEAALANLQALLEQECELRRMADPTHIEASQADGQLPDGVAPTTERE